MSKKYDHNYSNFESRLLDLIGNMSIVEYRSYKGRNILIRGKPIRNVKKFRQELFYDEIKELLNILKQRDIELEEVEGLLDALGSLKKDGKYVSKASFIKIFTEKVSEIIEKDRPYSNIIKDAYKMYLEKIELIKNLLKDYTLSDSTKFWTFLACFMVCLLKYMLENPTDINGIHYDVIPSFYIDFIYGFSYTEHKAHTVLEFKEDLVEDAQKIKALMDDSGPIYLRYTSFRKKLEKEGFTFDITKPILRKNYRRIFGKNWDSLILSIYPESKKGYERVLTEKGAIPIFRRLAAVLYIEIMVSRDNEEIIIIINRPLSKLERGGGELKTITRVLNEILNIDFNEIKLKARRYEINAKNFVRKIEDIFDRNIRRRLASALREFLDDTRNRIKEIIKFETLYYKSKLEQFASTLTLSKMYVKIIVENKNMINLEISLSPPKYEINDEYLEKVTDSIKNLVNKTRALLSEYAHLLKFGVTLIGKIDDEIVEIEFDNDGNIYFHNLRRDYATELSYIFSKIFEK